MTKLFINYALIILALLSAQHMFMSLWRSKSGRLGKWNQMFLPHDFFITLLLLASLWIIILINLAAAELPSGDKQIILVVSSLLAPFLTWWWRKQMGEEN